MKSTDSGKRIEIGRRDVFDTLRESGDAVATRDAISKRLAELGQLLKEGVFNGWLDVGDRAKTRIERQLED